MNIKKYTDRIGYHNQLRIDEETLVNLHDRHVFSVPFEDLDIHLNKPLSLNPKSIYHKVVLDKRGGFCYELNSIFCELLRQIGFECRMVSSRIYQENEVLSPPFDHMSVLVYLNDIWLVDVGYGNLFIKPIRLKENRVIKGHSKYFRIHKKGENVFLLSESLDGEEFIKRYEFDTSARSIEEFQEQCTYKQYSPDSYFVKNLICTLPTDKGRKTILNDKFSFKTKGSKCETSIESNTALISILNTEFDIELANGSKLYKSSVKE